MSDYHLLMKMPQSKLACKCIALEELLQRYHEFEEEHYNLQNKYRILLDKFEKLSRSNPQCVGEMKSDFANTASTSNKKVDEICNIGERIEIYELEDIETTNLIQHLNDENQRINQELQKSQQEIQQLKTKFHSQQNSPDQNYQDGMIGTLKKEISRLNKLVANLRLELSKCQTRELDEEWLRQQIILQSQKRSEQSSNLNNRSFNILDYVEQ